MKRRPRGHAAKSTLMAEHGPLQISNTPLIAPYVARESGFSVPFNFWDELGFTYWYVGIIMAYLIFLIINAFYDLQYNSYCIALHGAFHCYNDFSNLRSALINWIFIVSAVLLSLTVVLYNHWRRSIPTLFQELFSRNLIRSRITGEKGDLHKDGNIQTEYQSFLENYLLDLHNDKRYIFIGSLVILLAGFVFIGNLQLLWPSSYFPPILIWIRWFATLFRVFFISPLLGYYFGTAAWSIYVSGLYIWKLTSNFEVNIRPNHPDHCGGLKPLGTFCLDMTLPIITGGAFFELYGIGDTVDPNLLKTVSTLQVNEPADLALLAFVLLIGGITFFVPLLNIHRKMAASKEIYEDEFLDRSTKLEKKLWSSIEREVPDETRIAKEELESIQLVHPDKISYPEWPFDNRIQLTFLITYIIPIIIPIGNLIVHHG